MSDNPVQGMQENIEAAIHGAQSAFSSFTSSGGSSAGSSDVAGSSAGSSGDAEAAAGSSAIHDAAGGSSAGSSDAAGSSAGSSDVAGSSVTHDAAAGSSATAGSSAGAGSAGSGSASATPVDHMPDQPEPDISNGFSPDYSQDDVLIADPHASDAQNISSRDVDGDGSIDVVHSTTDGVQQIDYLDNQGEVILTDVDLDGNGTFETAVTTAEDNVVVASSDIDDDGDMDVISYADGATGQVFQEDTVEGNVVVDSQLDLDGDGITDVELMDDNKDGTFDVAAVDSDMDGHANVLYHDVNGDGNFDYAAFDSDGDGIMDTNVDASSYANGSVGSVDNFDNLGHDAVQHDAGMDGTF